MAPMMTPMMAPALPMPVLPAPCMSQALAIPAAPIPPKLKDSICAKFTQGDCTKGVLCAEAHNVKELAPGGIKPRLCPGYNGTCHRGDVCLLAHSSKELW